MPGYLNAQKPVRWPILTITTVSLPNGTSGVAYGPITLTAKDGTQPYRWQLINGPSWINRGDAGALPGGVLSGTPNVVGPTTIVVQVSDNFGSTASASYPIQVVATNPSITTASIPGASVGVAYSTTLVATGGVTPYTWSILSDVPGTGGWLGIGPSTGTLTGTPGTAETEALQIQVADNLGHTGTANYSLPVAATPPTITTSSLTSGEVGAAYSLNLAATGNTPITWGISASPNTGGWLTVTAVGHLQGTPGTVETESVTGTATDRYNQSSNRSWNLIVIAGPSITTSSLPNGQVGTAYSQTLSASGGTPPYTWSMPPNDGLTLSSGGVLSGTPVTAGTNTLAISLTDSVGGSASANISWTVTSSGGGATLVFNYPNFSGAPSTINLIGSASPIATYSGNNILFASASGHWCEGAWYKTQQNISGGFTTSFAITPSLGSTPVITGFCFAIHNVVNNGNPFGFSGGIQLLCDANMSGIGAYDLSGQYFAIPSVEIVFMQSSQNNNTQDYKTGGLPSTMGLYINGGNKGAFVPEIDLVPCGINLYSGHQFACTVVYDNTNLTLTLVIQDATTLASSRYTWPINIPAVLGGNLGWVGFTYADGPGVNVTATLNSWNFYTGINTRLATPTFSPPGGSYASSQTVTITPPAGSFCYFTTNGLPPTNASTLYTGPITVSANEYVQAVAIQSGFTDSFVGGANYLINAANTINFGSGFSGATGLVTAVGNAAYSGSVINLTVASGLGNGPYGNAGAVWYVAPINIATFTTVLHWTPNSNVQGGCFVIQNQNGTATDTTALTVSGGPFAVGGFGAGYGYSMNSGTGVDITGLQTSVAVFFSCANNTVGVVTNGVNPTGGTAVSGITIGGGHTLQLTISYNGTVISVTIKDLTTSVTAGPFNFTKDIVSIVGGSTAYVGFTASANFVTQTLNSWTM